MSSRRFIFAACVALALATPSASAQSVNIDFGVKAGVPSADFAGAGRAGFWNGVTGDGAALAGLGGGPTSIVVALPIETSAFADSETSGEEAKLLDDGLSGLGDVFLTITLTGIQPGRYRLVTYAWTPGAPADTTLVDVFGDFWIAGGPWPGELEEGITHGVHELVITSGTLSIGYGGGVWGHVGFINGIQLERHCAADVNLDQVVNVDDLIRVVQDWGPCTGCAADINGDGQVDVDDLLEVIVGWGPCSGSQAALCTQSGGIWDPLSCGHYICGDFPDCDAIIPGCDCGPGRNFVEGVGCVDDEECE